MDKLQRILQALKREGASHISIIYCRHKPDHTAVALKFLVKHKILEEIPVPA